MRNKTLLLVIMTCCISLLSVDAFANKAAVIRKIFKSTGNATRDHEFFRSGAYITSKHLYKRNTQDSLYYDSLSLQVHSQRLYNSMNVPPFNLESVNTQKDTRKALLPKSSDEDFNVRERNFNQNYVASYWDSLEHTFHHPHNSTNNPAFEIKNADNQTNYKDHTVKENSKADDNRILEEYSIEFTLAH